MGKILAYYTKYLDNVPDYTKWNKEQATSPAKFSLSEEQKVSLQKKAKAITDPILISDRYEHEKAEDSEAFFQTLNIEIMSLASLITSLPIALAKIAPFLSRHSDKRPFLKKISDSLNKYSTSFINIGNKKISLSKAATVVSGLIGGIFYINGIKKSMESQLGIIRKASFDSSKEIINNPKLFAILTPEQEKEVNNLAVQEKKAGYVFVDKLKDKININTSFKTVKDYTLNYPNYRKQKENYFDEIKENKTVADNQKENQVLYSNYVKNVEHEVLEDLRRVETISNITYSAMFTGGFLEYLMTDKLVDVLKIKNKPLSMAVKLAVPLITYLILNKNISDIENKAILATKYKHIKNFSQNPEKAIEKGERKKLIPFIKSVIKDMKDYEKFSDNELNEIEHRLEEKKEISLTKEQEKEAQILQKNTAAVINKHRENVYDQSVGIKAFSETILGPIDIIATAVGGRIGYNLSKKCPNKKISGMLTGLGAIIAFIPAAIIEAKLTKQQKLSEKIAAMLTVKEIEEKPYFESNNVNNLSFNKSDSIFKDFIQL